MKGVYVAILTPIAGSLGYKVRIPDVSGCVTSGTNIAETLNNIKDALAACLCTLEDNNDPVPEPSLPENIACDEQSIIALVEVDTLKYREETDTRAVRKNVSMPAWLLRMAESRGVNCSQVLQDALKREFGLIK